MDDALEDDPDEPEPPDVVAAVDCFVDVLEVLEVLEAPDESDEVDEAAASFFLGSPEPEPSVAAGVDALLAAARESVL